MKTLITYLLPLIVLLSPTKIIGQQNSLFNTYSLDPLQLNIAYAGASCTEANAHYRTQWLGLSNSPVVLQLNAHTAIDKSNGIGLKISSQKAGLLNTLGATVGYAYRIQVSETAKLHLGLGIGFTQAALNAQKAIIIDASDVTLNNAPRQTANGFDSEAGVMFIDSKLKAGISALHLYNSNPSFSGNSTYKSLPQLNTHVSYIFNKDKKIEIEPWLLSRYTIRGNNVIEGIVNVHFMKMISAGVGYRSNYGVLVLIGAKVSNVKLAYSFDYGTSKNKTTIGSSHQVMLGFSLCKTPKTKQIIEAPLTTDTIKDSVNATIVKKDSLNGTSTDSTNIITNKETTKPTINYKKTISEINTISDEVVFPLNESVLEPASIERINKIATVLKNNPEIKVRVKGYTCNVGTQEQNEELAVKRAKYVREKLLQTGVKPTSIDTTVKTAVGRVLYDNAKKSKHKNRTIRFEYVK